MKVFGQAIAKMEKLPNEARMMETTTGVRVKSLVIES